jgi:hypothetical protein
MYQAFDVLNKHLMNVKAAYTIKCIPSIIFVLLDKYNFNELLEFVGFGAWY